MATRKPLYMNADEGFPVEMPATDSLQLGGLAMTGAITMGGFNITGLPSTPSGSDAAASKDYVDSVAQGLIVKPPVHVVAVSNVAALTGFITVDGHLLVNNDRVLLTAQTAVKFSGTGDSLAGTFSGTGAGVSLATVTGTTTLTDTGAAFVAADVGKLITVSGSADPLNDGTFEILSRPSGTTVTYVNPTPGADDAGPTISYLSDDVRLTDAGATFTIAQEHEKIILSGTTGGLNDGTFEIRKYISGTAVIYTNPTGVTETSAFTYTGEVGVDNGIWLAHSGAWTRATDMAAASHASHDFMFVELGTLYANTGWVCTDTTPEDLVGSDRLTFVQFSAAGVITAGAGLDKTGNVISVKKGDGIEVTSNSASTNIDLATNPGLALTGSSPNKKLSALVDANGGVQINGASGLALLLNGTTLQSGSSGASVKGLPANFEVATVATHSATPGTGQVTAANLDTLTAGSTSNADALHVHTVSAAPYAGRVEDNFTVGANTILAGDPVYQTSTYDVIDKGDCANDAKSRIIGVARVGNTSGNLASIVEMGPCATVLSAATAGTPYYLASGGGVTTTRPTGNKRVICVGFAKNATDLHVHVIDYGKAA